VQLRAEPGRFGSLLNARRPASWACGQAGSRSAQGKQ